MNLFVLALSLTGCLAVTRPSIFTATDNGFTLQVGSIVVFQHSYDAPMIYVGLGKTTFNELQGNFHIEDDINRRIGLRNYTRNVRNWTDEIIFTEGEFSVRLFVYTYAELSFDITTYNLGSPYDYLWLRIVANSTEQVYGGGEQFTHLNLREYSYAPGRNPEFFSVSRSKDRVYPIWIREQGVGRDKSDQVTFFADKMMGAGGDFHTTYFPQPTFISSRKYLFHYSGNNYMTFDFSHDNFHEVFIKGDVSNIFMAPGNSTLDLVKTYIINTVGRMAALPDWLRDGAILGVQGGTDIMMKRLDDAQAQGVAVNGLWIQDWAGIKKTSFGQRLFWNWKWDPVRYPGLDQKIKDFKAKGIRVLAYINPNLNIEGDMYKEAASKGFVVKNKTGRPYILDFGEFYCGIVDLTNPDAFTWYKGQITTNMINLGLGGWMADFGEYLPVDAVVSDTSIPIHSVHNKWPVLWAKLNRQAVEDAGKLGEIVFWMRAGSTGTSNYTTLMWAGDQNVDFSYGDGLPSTIVAATSMGIMGTGLTHFDIGGYTTFGTLGLRRTPELLLRSAEMAVFTPVMRTHEGNQPEANIQVYSTPYILQQFARLVKIYKMLSNYTTSVIKECIISGVPAQRALLLHYENDPIAVSSKYQYMYGPDLLIAPVIQSNVTIQTVYLPKDEWVFIWDNTTQSSGGTSVNVSAPIGKPPVFYKKGSVYAATFDAIGKIPLVPPPPTPTPTQSIPKSTKSTNTNSASKITVYNIMFAFISLFCMHSL